jgi:hypothetical protein
MSRTFLLAGERGDRDVDLRRADAAERVSRARPSGSRPGGPALTSSRGAERGGRPRRTQRFSAASALDDEVLRSGVDRRAAHDVCRGTGLVSLMIRFNDVGRRADVSPAGDGVYVSACAVPATSQRRKLLPSSCRALK